MATPNPTCFRCKQKILNWPYSFGGHKYCYECFQIVQEEGVAEENNRASLYEAIRRIFSVKEVPEEVINAINRELKKGKKLKGLEGTLHYYYEIMGNPANSIRGVIYVFADQYENAKRYLQNSARIAEHNRSVDLTPKTVTVRVTPESLQKGHDKPSYNIEDL